jgi:hypothetical protein
VLNIEILVGFIAGAVDLRRYHEADSKRSRLALVAVILLAVTGTSLFGQGQPQNQAPRPARSRADETLAMWNNIGSKLIAMAQDFPEDKYDFKVQKHQRTFAQTLLHVAGVDYLLMRTVSGPNIGPASARTW